MMLSPLRQKGSQSQAAAVAARTWSPEGAPPAAAMSVDPSDLRSSSSSSHSQQHPARNGTSPVSAAVRRVSVNIPDLSPNEDVPLNLLPFFKYLSEEARRGIMRQLISSFSRSSISPMVSDALMRGGASRAAGDRSSFGAAGDIAGLEGALRPANPSTPGFLTPAMMSMIEEQLGENGDQDLGLADFRWEMTPTMGHPGHDPMGAPPSTVSGAPTAYASPTFLLLAHLTPSGTSPLRTLCLLCLLESAAFWVVKVAILMRHHFYTGEMLAKAWGRQVKGIQ
jgi:hypothetical protein